MSYNKEIEKRYKQQQRMKNKFDAAARKNVEKGEPIKLAANLIKRNKLDKSMSKLSADYVSYRKKKGYN
jgi:hypothetical protein